MTKMRWRDSGAAAEPNLASISSAAGVSTTAPTRMRAPRPSAREPVCAEDRQSDSGGDRQAVTGDEVPGRLTEVAQHVERRAEATAASADADLEAAGQNEVGAPERDAQHEDDRERQRRLTEPQPRSGDIDRLGGEHERAVRVCRDAEQGDGDPRCPAATSTRLRRRQQRQEREQAREQEEAVHASVDAVEEQHPAGGSEDRGDDGRALPRQARGDYGKQRQAGHGEDGGNGAQRRQPAVEMRDGPREEEVERCAAPLVEHRAQHSVERVPTDEERQRLVLMRRPGGQAQCEKDGHCRRARRNDGREGPLGKRLARGCRGPVVRDCLGHASSLSR